MKGFESVEDAKGYVKTCNPSINSKKIRIYGVLKDSKKEKKIIKYHAIANGRKVGVFLDLEYANYQVSNFEDNIWRTFDNLRGAKHFVTRNNPDVKPEEIKLFEKTQYYAVATGEKIGIFLTEDCLKKQIVNISNVVIRRFEQLKSAKEFIYSYNKSLRIIDIVIYDDEINGCNISDKEFYYVLINKDRSNFEVEVLNTLEELSQIDGYKIRKFFNRDNAHDFAKEIRRIFEKSKTDEEKILERDYIEKRIEQEKSRFKPDIIYAFTDGSYMPDINTIGYSVVFVKNYEKILETSNSNFYEFDDGNGSVVAELKASLMAVNVAIENKFNDICICYDFDGVKKYIDELPLNPTTYVNEYRTFIYKKSNIINLSFKKVKAHQYNEWNNLADELAKNDAKKLIS